MVGLVDAVAPRTWGDAVAKSVMFLALISGMDVLVLSVSGQLRLSLVAEVTTATVIALPFVVLAAAVLFHQRRLQNRLSILATTDELSGLPNRRDFMTRTQAALERDVMGLLLLLDADHFKRINDHWGHNAGDACLVAIGFHLRAILQDSDILGRLGGEEFAAFLPRAQLDHAWCLAERLCCPIPVAAGEVPEGLFVTLSVGIAPVHSGLPLDRLLAQADFALYRAKAKGRARVEVWAEEDGVDQAA